MKSLNIAQIVVTLAASVNVAWAAGEHAGEHGSAQQHQMSGGGTPHSSRAGERVQASSSARMVDLEMKEFRFAPQHVEVQAGETVHFRVRNAGKIEHELIFGSAAELKAHAEQMRKQPAMAHHASGGLTLGSGKAGEMTWKFTNAGEFQYACLIPGHFEAGMFGQVSVK